MTLLAIGINWQSWLLWGFLSTFVLTGLMSVGQGLGLSRISVPFLLGSVFTPRRDKARALGFVLHFTDGWAIAVVYALIFESLGAAAWWIGTLIGLLHALFLLAVLLPLLPAIHPRMAAEDQGPDPTRQLEPPGFCGLNYGRRTPLLTLFAHLCYGAIFGAFYHLS